MQLKFNEKIENTNIGTICYNNLYKNAASSYFDNRVKYFYVKEHNFFFVFSFYYSLQK